MWYFTIAEMVRCPSFYRDSLGGEDRCQKLTVKFFFIFLLLVSIIAVFDND